MIFNGDIVGLQFLILQLHLLKSICGASQIFNYQDQGDRNLNMTISTCCKYQNSFLNESCIRQIDYKKSFPDLFDLTIDSFRSEISVQVSSSGFECGNGSFVKKILRSNPTKTNFKANGYLIADLDLFPPDRYCLNSLDDTSMEIVICTPVCAQDSLCLPLCSEDSIIGLDLYQSKRNFTQVAEASELISKDWNILDVDTRPLPHFIVSRLNCISQGRTFHTEYYIDLEDIVRNNSFTEEGQPDKFCISSISQGNGTVIFSVLTCGNEWPYDEFGLSPIEVHLYGVTSIFSVVFMMAALIIYLSLWKRQTVHTWTQFCYILSLLGLYCCIVGGIYIPQDLNNLCVFSYFLKIFLYHIFFYQVITWLTILSFDLFLSFWRLKPSVGRTNPSLRRFYIYAAIGWVMPIVVLVVSVLTHPHRAKAGYCVGHDNLLSEYYALLTVLANIGFVVATFIQILKHRKNSKFATQNASKHQKHLLSLFAKLFFITGITFSGVIAEAAFKTTRARSSIPLYAFRALICLQGVVVFVVYLCNKKTWNQLVQRYPKIKNLSIRSIGSLVTQSTQNTPMEMQEQKN